MNQNPRENENTASQRLQFQQAVSAMVTRSEKGSQTESTTRARRFRNRRSQLAVLAFALLLAATATLLLRSSAALGGDTRRTTAAQAHVDKALPTTGSGNANSAPIPAVTLKMSGFFTAHDLVQISATVLARVEKIHVSEGMSVKKGDVLVELSNIRGENDVQSAQQRLASSVLQRKMAELALQHEIVEQQRQANLTAQGFGTRKASGDVELRLNQARLELARAHTGQEDALATLRAYQRTLLEYTIRAPFSGLVVAQNARVGEVVSPTNGGSYIRSGLLSLLNPATLEVEVSVQERLLPQLRSASCALVSSLAQPDQIRAVTFQLGRINNTADRQRGAVNAVLVPVHPMRVLPILETSAEVEFVSAGDSRCSAPQHAQ